MHRKLHYWCLALCLLGAMNNFASAQCTVGSLLNAGATTNNSSVAQSFVMNCPADGFFSSVTILNTSNATNVTLEIFQGDNLDGTVQYTQTGISLQLLSPTQNIIILQGGTGSLAFTAGNSYVFRLTAQSPLFLSKNIGSLMSSLYADGMLFEGNTPQPAEDLLFTVTSTAVNPLPVRLSFFDVRMDGEDAVLYWETESEQNNAGFEIQHSRDARKWKKIGFAEGQGTTTGKHSYEYVHPKPGAGLHYYRLFQMDYDGAGEASPLRVLEGRAAAGANLLVYPNPVRKGEALYVSGIPPGASSHSVLFDAQGQKVAGFRGDEAVSLPANIRPGAYLLKVTVDGASSFHRILIVE